MKAKSRLSLRSSPTGFGLIELLVAIAIIAVLATIIFSLFGSIRRVAGDAKCASNLRLIVMAGIAYANDRGGQLPDGVAWHDERDAQQRFSLVPYLYGSNSQKERADALSVLLCPLVQENSGFRHNDLNAEGKRKSYALNQHALGSNNSGTGMGDYNAWVEKNNPPMYLHRVQKPAITPFFLDGPGIKDQNGNRYSTFSNQARAGDKAVGELVKGAWKTPYLHSGETIAIAFFDGRVDLVTHAQVLETGERRLNWSGN